MRRSLRLVAAAWWLLQLGACGDQPSPRSPHAARSTPEGDAAKPASARQNGVPAQATPAGQDRESGSENPRRGHEAGAAHDLGSTSQQLAERHGKTRALAVLRGSGSYYADKFAGRATASGAPYEPRGFTAAHRSLPFGTILRVTRVDGGQSVYVRVTDRGPFGPRGRILDLSRAAAEQLGMMRVGVAKLRVEVVEYGPRKPRRRRR